MSSVISSPSNITIWLGPTLAVALAYLASAACSRMCKYMFMWNAYTLTSLLAMTAWSEPTQWNQKKEAMTTQYSHLYAIPSPTWLQNKLPSCECHCYCSRAGHSNASHECDAFSGKVFVLVIDENVVQMIFPVPRNESGLCCHIDCLVRTLLPQGSWTDRGALPGNNWPQCMSDWIAVVHLLGYSVGFQQSLVVWIHGGLITNKAHLLVLHPLGSQTDQKGRPWYGYDIHPLQEEEHFLESVF